MSVGLLKDLKDGKLTRSIYFQFFCSELRKSLKAMEICKKLAVESKDKDITLLCYEKEEIFCHRLCQRNL